LIGLGNPPIFAVESLALTRGNENDSKAVPATQRKETAIVNVARVIAIASHPFEANRP